MSVINTNVSSLIAQNSLAQNNKALSTSLERLSTGVQINSAADNPAGLIAVQTFNQTNTGLTTAINNAGQAANVVGTAEGGLNEVSNLLTQLQGLVGQAANSGASSSAQINADQLQVDSILNTINRIAGNTTFNGTHLLNGNLSYVTATARPGGGSGGRDRARAWPCRIALIVLRPVAPRGQEPASTRSSGRGTRARSIAPASSHTEFRDCVKYRRRRPGISFGKPSQSPGNALFAARVA